MSMFIFTPAWVYIMTQWNFIRTVCVTRVIFMNMWWSHFWFAFKKKKKFHRWPTRSAANSVTNAAMAQLMSRWKPSQSLDCEWVCVFCCHRTLVCQCNHYQHRCLFFSPHKSRCQIWIVCEEIAYQSFNINPLNTNSGIIEHRLEFCLKGSARGREGGGRAGETWSASDWVKFFRSLSLLNLHA